MGEHLDFPEIMQEVRGVMHPGRLKLQSSNVIFKNIKTGIVEQFSGADITESVWLIRAKGHCLKLILENGSAHRFEGFKETDFDRLSAFLSTHYDTTLEKQDISLKGWNWGVANFKGNALNFEVGGLSAFEIPLGNVSHSTSSKNEVTLEFHQNDDAPVSLMEMRFHIPGDTNADDDPVQEFYNNVIAKADVIQETGDTIATFEEIPCLTPRGRYDLKIFPTFLQLHGKTFDYKIPYSTILRLFLLPHRDNRQMFFVLSLDPPIKQGQTRYHFVIVLFNKEDETTLEIALDEDEIESKYAGKLQKEMSGPEYEVVSRIMKAVCNRKITVPGSFLGNSGSQCIQCSYKAGVGSLYPLERGFVFVHKPVLHIRFDEIAHVNFARSSGNTRSFDFDVNTKSSLTYTFVGIEKDEYGRLFDFVKMKKLRVKNVGDMKGTKSYAEDMEDSDEGQHDAYMERMKNEGKDRVVVGTEGGDDESDDSSDESFNPPESGSEVAEEYDSEWATSSSSEESGSGSGGSNKASGSVEKKEKKEKKPRKEKESVSESTGKKRKSGKKDKDPNRPKRPTTAYMSWLNEMRDSIKLENPTASVIEIAKIGGELWKKLEDKSKWNKKAEEAKEVWKEQMAEYNQGSGGGKRKTESPARSPTKSVSSTKSPSKSSYKSKEFISESESEKSNDSDSDEKTKSKSKMPVKKKPEEASSSADESEQEEKKSRPKKVKKKPKKDSSSEEDKPKRKRTRNTKGDSDSSEVGELPSEEEILSSPEHSKKGSASEESAESVSEDEDWKKKLLAPN